MDDEGEVLGGLLCHTEGREGDDHRGMPCPHPGLYRYDDRHTAHGEGDTRYREGDMLGRLKGKERQVEVEEVAYPDHRREEEELPPLGHVLDAHHPLPDMDEEACYPALPTASE